MANFYVKMGENGGNDNYDGVSWNTAVATLQRALNLAMSNDTIIFDEGEFEGCYDRNKNNGYWWYAIYSPNKAKNITIKSKRPGKTVFKYLIDTDCKNRDYPIVAGSSLSNHNSLLDFMIIGIIFEVTKNKELGNYSCSLVSHSVVQFYNCVFIQNGTYKQYSYIYFNGDYPLSSYNNCAFINGATILPYSGKYMLINNASNEKKASMSGKILNQVNFNPSTFSITSTKGDNVQYGVYSGLYKWPLYYEFMIHSIHPKFVYLNHIFCMQFTIHHTEVYKGRYKYTFFNKDRLIKACDFTDVDTYCEYFLWLDLPDRMIIETETGETGEEFLPMIKEKEYRMICFRTFQNIESGYCLKNVLQNDRVEVTM